jgi:hypothetical protein
MSKDEMGLTEGQVIDIATRQSKEVKKRGSKQASVEANCSATTDEVKQIIANSFYWFNYPIVKSDEECAERLNEFFTHCNQTGELPTVEKMCLALGTTRKTVWTWEQGELGTTRSNIIKKAKEILASIDAELVSAGKIPQITYIFRAKNFFGMTDKQELVVTPNNPMETLDADEARQRLTTGLPDIE